MNKEKIILCISTIIGMAAAGWFFFWWNPEGLLKRDIKPVSVSDITKNPGESFTGRPAGKDIPILNGAEDFDKMIAVDYASAKPVSAVPTGVYKLKPWVNPYKSRKSKGRSLNSGKRKPEVIKSGLDIQEDYNQFYILGLPDGTNILALISKSDASAINKGKDITLPIGQKLGLTNAADSTLDQLCQEYQVTAKGVFYTFDNEWYQKHYFTLLLIRFGAAAVVLLAVGVSLILIGNKVFHVKEENE